MLIFLRKISVKIFALMALMDLPSAALASAAEPFTFDVNQAQKLAQLSLECIDREYPNLLHHVIDSDANARLPRQLHPAFYGCLDWHSAVHGHWALVRILRIFPNLPLAEKIRTALQRHLTAANINAELDYLKKELNQTFERPYGWAWLLRLAAELKTFHNPAAQSWALSLEPLSQHLSALTINYLEKLSQPVRAGTHQSTAFALTHIYDYAVATGDKTLQEVVARRSRHYFINDKNCPTAYEPSGEDFISPCLVEADLMQRVLDQQEFSRWLSQFLPPLNSPEMKSLLTPVDVTDPKDYRIGHLIGLAFQRAASYKNIARALTKDDPRHKIFMDAAARHGKKGLEQITSSGYGGSHWLASFAIFNFTNSGPYTL